MFVLLQKAIPTAYGLCPETLLPEITKHKKIWLPSAAEAPDTTECAGKSSIQDHTQQRHLMPLSKAIKVTLIRRPLKISSMTGQNPIECSEYPLYFCSKTMGLHGPSKETKIHVFRSPCKLLTCFKACSSRLCLETESLQTVSQRVLSSWSCPLTQVVSSLLFSISSLPDRFRT